MIAPYQDDLYQCLQAGIRAWHLLKERASDLYVPLKRRTRACFIYDHVCNEAYHRFDGKPGIRIDNAYKFPMVIIKDLVAVRFKKADQFLRTSNIRTRQQQKLFGGRQMVFPFLQDVPTLSPFRASAVYQLDDVTEEMTGSFITHQIGRELIWSFPLLGTVIEVAPYTLPLTEQPEGPKPKITPKKPFQDSGEAIGQ